MRGKQMMVVAVALAAMAAQAERTGPWPKEKAWACPSGELLAWELSREVWGRESNRSHYFIRKGEHNIRESNWIDILDFAKSHGW